MRKLFHPNIMKLQSVYETDNSIYMILELLQGGNLAEQIQSGKNFSIEEIRNILQGITNALVEMEAKNIIHRDLKPENLLFKDIPTDFTNISIADFGFASEITFDKHLFPKCGTPGYVAPEILSDSYKINCKCDIFSLGIIFHQLLLSCQPFHEMNQIQLLKQNAKCNINYLDEKYQSLSNESLDLLQKMLEKNPEKRINSQEILEHPFFFNNNGQENAMSESGDNYINIKCDNFKKLKEQEFKMNFNKINSLAQINCQNQLFSIDSPQINKFQIYNLTKDKDNSQFNPENNFIVKSTLFSGNLTNCDQIKKINTSPELEKNLEINLFAQKQYENNKTDPHLKISF